MSSKNHDRSPDKKGFSVALPKSLLAEIESIAEKENRTRNGQITHFLAGSVARWKAEKKAAKEEDELLNRSHLSMVADAPNPSGNQSSPSTPAHGAQTGQTKYPKGTRRKKEG